MDDQRIEILPHLFFSPLLYPSPILRTWGRRRSGSSHRRRLPRLIKEKKERLKEAAAAAAARGERIRMEEEEEKHMSVGVNVMRPWRQTRLRVLKSGLLD
jgi:hypothetical protein